MLRSKGIRARDAREDAEDPHRIALAYLQNDIGQARDEGENFDGTRQIHGSERDAPTEP